MRAMTKTLTAAALCAAGLAALSPRRPRRRPMSACSQSSATTIAPATRSASARPRMSATASPRSCARRRRARQNESWASRAQSMEYVGRSGTDSCSPVGGGGWTGCYAELVRKAREERKAAAAERPELP